VSAPWFERDPAAYAALESLLHARYPTLHAFIENGECRVRGTYAAIDGDRYAVEIAVPANYPCSLPDVWETGGRIPREIDRHVFPASGALCLGVPLALWIAMKGDFSVDRVLDGPVRSFLIGNSLVEEGAPWPHGDRSHGAAGILEHFGELVGTADPTVVGSLLVDLLKHKVRGHWLCPCGSGRIIRKCHRKAVETLRQAPPSMLAHAVETIVKDPKHRREMSAAA
jgi:hypothetical protein